MFSLSPIPPTGPSTRSTQSVKADDWCGTPVPVKNDDWCGTPVPAASSTFVSSATWLASR